MQIQSVGVVGAGTMGIGVTQSLIQAGYAVVLLDLSSEILQRAQTAIQENLRFHALFHKQEAQESREKTLGRISLAATYERFSDVDFLIENVTEKWEIKKAVYQQLNRTCPPHCIFAANTSALSITRLASVTDRPSQVLGMHFMNPVPMKPVVEVIRGHHTSDETLDTAREFLASMGKSCIVVNDMPGFVSNRVLMLTLNEAIFLIQDQVASIEEVDTLFKSCFGHKMGPLETADLIGLDTVLYSIEALYESYNDSKYRPCPLLRKMVDAGLYGRKNGQGFYTYP